MKNLEIGEYLRDHRNRSYSHPDGKNDGQRKTVPVGAGKRGPDEPRTEYQSECERYAGADNGQPAHFAAFFASEELLSFRTGEEHQQ